MAHRAPRPIRTLRAFARGLTLVLALVLTLVTGSPVRGEEATRGSEPQSEGETAQAWREAFDRADDDALRILARRLHPDPFSVAALLLFGPAPARALESGERERILAWAARGSAETGMREFTEHWLGAGPEAWEAERGLRQTLRAVRLRPGKDSDASLERLPASADGHAHSYALPWLRLARAGRLLARGDATAAATECRSVAEEGERRRWPALEARARYVLAGALLRQHARAQAVIELRRVATVTTASGDLDQAVQALRNLSSQEQVLGRLDAAEAAVYEALVHAPGRPTAGEPWDLRLRLAEIAEARGHVQSAHVLWERAFLGARAAGQTSVAAQAAADLIWRDLLAGRPAEALERGRWLEESLPRIDDPAGRGSALESLAWLAEWTGEVEIALKRYEEAGESWGLLPGAAGRRLQALLHLARLATRQGRREVAEAALARSRASVEPLSSNPGGAALWSDLAEIYADLDLAEAAEGAARRALALAQASPGDHALPRAWLVLARTLRKHGDAAAAEAAAREALAQLRALGGEEPEFLVEWGACLARLGRRDPAVDALRRAAELWPRRRRGLARDELLGLAARERQACGVGVGAALGTAPVTPTADTANLVWWFREMGEAQSLRGALRPGGPRARPVPAAAPIGPLLDRVEARHRAWLHALECDEGSEAGARAALLAVQQEVGVAESEAARSTWAADPPEPWTLDLAAVRAALPEDTAVLAFTRDAESLVGLAATRGKVVCVRLGRVPDVGPLLDAWMRLASTPGGPEGKTALRLHALLLEPLADVLDDAPRWIVLPDDLLGSLSLDALARREGESVVRVLERHTLVYVHSEGVRSALLHRDRTRRPGTALLALGDPAPPTGRGRGPEHTTEHTTARVVSGRSTLPPLPGSRFEVQGVAATYATAERRLLLGGEARLETWLAAATEAAAPWDALHLACHGLVDERVPRLSGLVFAEAEVLTATRLEHISLDARLAVLSACASAEGRRAEGEGVLGLVRAFFLAGVARVVCSTWNQSDETASRLMPRFYAERRLGGGEAEALRRARLALLRDERFAHPYHWAGWQLWGLPE